MKQLKKINYGRSIRFILIILFVGMYSCVVNDDLGEIRNLRASQGVYNDRVLVEWDIVTGATYYILEKKEDGASNYGKATQGTMNLFEDYGISAGTKYFYRLIAKNGNDTVGPSEPVMGCAGTGCQN